LELDLVCGQVAAHKEFRLAAQGPQLLLSLGIPVDLEARDELDLVRIVGHHTQVIRRVVGHGLLPFHQRPQTDEAAVEIPRLIHHLRFALDSSGAQAVEAIPAGIRRLPEGLVVDQGERNPHLIKGVQRVKVQKAVCKFGLEIINNF